MVFTITSDNVTIAKNVDKGSVWKQIIFSIIAYLPFFTHGVETNTLTSSSHSGHFVRTPDDVPWSTTAIVVASILSAPVYCYLINQYGRKMGIYSLNLVQGASCVPLFLTSSTANNMALHIFAGLSSGGIFTVLPIYVREITCDKYRGLTLSFMTLMMASGYLIKFVMSLETMMYLILSLVGIQLLLLYFLVESPCYLIKMTKFEEAAIVVASLKCLPEDNPSVLEELKTLIAESERAKAHGKLNLITVFKNRIWCDEIKIGIFLRTIISLSGSIVFMDQHKALAQLEMIDTGPEHSMVLYCMFAGGAVCIGLSMFLDRKYLLTIALTIIVLAMGLLAVYTQENLTVKSNIVPLSAFVVLVFGYGVAYALPEILMVEMLNFEIRPMMIGVLYSYTQIIKLVHVHTFHYIEDYMGLYTIFYIFAGINLLGAVYSLFTIPNIQNKSVKQIERQLKRIPLIDFNVKVCKAQHII